MLSPTINDIRASTAIIVVIPLKLDLLQWLLQSLLLQLQILLLGLFMHAGLTDVVTVLVCEHISVFYMVILKADAMP